MTRVGAGHAARRVDVLDAHQPAPAVRARVEPARQRGDQRAGVQRPGGRRREAAAVGARLASVAISRSRPACRSSSARARRRAVELLPATSCSASALQRARAAAAPRPLRQA